jgi:hypothetical protein
VLGIIFLQFSTFVRMYLNLETLSHLNSLFIS